MELNNCPCAGGNLPRFVHPAILGVLAQGPLHGYRILQQLAATRLFQNRPPDQTGVYRMLKGMEQEGLLHSEQAQGRAAHRRIFSLTDKGRACLARWERTLIGHQATIANLLLFLEEAQHGNMSVPAAPGEDATGLFEAFSGTCDCGTVPDAGESPRALVDRLKAAALRGVRPAREDILRLLAFPSGSPEAACLGTAAREVARTVCGDAGRIWCAIGVDCRPCSMNCEFCAFGERWGVVSGVHEWSVPHLLDTARGFVSGGASWLTLRTTEFYSREMLLALARRVRAEIPGDYGLVVNTGEFGDAEAHEMSAAGISAVYHSLRLGEGRNTRFSPAERCRTLEAVRDSPLALAHLVEPVGPEHSDEEIADVLLKALEYGASLCGAMARVNVRGTPFGGTAALDEARLARIVAVTRLCGGTQTPDICVHPPTPQALDWGANVVVVETGAVPRAEEECRSDWQAFGIGDARKMLTAAGYRVQAPQGL